MTDPSPPPSAFLIRTLGRAELVRSKEDGQFGAPLLGVGKPLALLAFCSCSRDREYSRDLIASLLWGDSERVRARQNLRQALWRLRRVVGDNLLVRDEMICGVGLAIGSDREQFLAAAHRGDDATALALYAGPFLRGLSVPGGDEFEDWASLERRQLENTLLRVTERYSRELLRAGRRALASQTIDHLLLVAADSVDAHRIAVEVRLEMEDRAGAARAADSLEALARELGESALPSMDALVARARSSTVASSSEIAGPPLLDLVGRDTAFDTVLTAWKRARSGHSQVVVLLGPAGIGKSRLLGAIASRCKSRHTVTATIRANAGERDVPFGFASAIARALSSLPGAAGVSEDSARELVALDPALSAIFARTPAKEDGREMLLRRSLAVLDLLSAITEQNPLALCLDDFHWADNESRRMLAILGGRIDTLALLLVVTSRVEAQEVFAKDNVIAVPLLPLDLEECIDAVRSVGNWVDSPGASRFVETLARVSEGVPLSIVERLEMALERGLLVDSADGWDSPDWDAAANEIAVASPVSRRIATWTQVERTVLLVLAVAGTPLTEALLSDAVSRLNESVEGTLDALRRKGVLAQAADGWRPSHDLVAESLLQSAVDTETEAIHRALAQAYQTDVGSDAAHRSLRHFLSAGDDGSAGSALRRCVARARERGDLREARSILADVGGHDLGEERVRSLLRSIPFRLRIRRVRERATIAVLIVVMLCVATAWGRAVMLPSLVVMQSSLVSIESATRGLSSMDTLKFGRHVRRAQLPVIIGLGDAPHEPGAATAYVRVRAMSRTTTIVAGDSVPVIDGSAAFNRLRFFESDSVSRFRFEANGYRHADVVLRQQVAEAPAIYGTRLRLSGGNLNAQPMGEDNLRIEVPVGVPISGTLEFEFATPYVAASVWLSMTPSWGDPATVGRELSPVTTPVRSDVASIPLNVTGPDTPGDYWLLFLLAAEPSGMFGLSGTNWTLERPVWGDGNDIATLADSVIRRANAEGTFESRIAMPIDWASAQGCPVGTTAQSGALVRYCPQSTTLVGIEVIVR